MLGYILILITFSAVCAAGDRRGVGPHFPATKGEVWPKPQHQIKNNTVLTFNHAQFHIKVVGVTCPLMSRVVARYSHLFARQSHLAHRGHDHSHGRSRMSELRVNMTGPCEKYPHFDMHEDYSLTIAKKSILQSSSIWGILRGLQTVLHSFYLSDDYGEILINAMIIIDFPRFPHRGLMLDTARHYISLKNILLVLDAMEMNKMNVFHWHIVDDESFPYQSQKFPELSEHAAYHPTMVYSKADIAIVVKYARERGIRVIPEFDVPGHTLSWGVSHPEVLLKCVDYSGIQRGVMNPVNKATFDLLGAVVKEVQDLFPDKSFHVGGDEISQTCWDGDQTVQTYVQMHNLSNTDVLPMFMKKIFALLGERSQPIVWQDILENMHLPDNILVQIWKSDPIVGYDVYDDNGEKSLNKVLEAGNKAILSAPWYLDKLQKGCWDYYHQTDPAAMVVNKSLIHNVLGGEACMWGESIDDSNVISRHNAPMNDKKLPPVHKINLCLEALEKNRRKKLGEIIWPRASTIAEILWSSPPFEALGYHVNRNRLEEHTCRMLRHDIGAQPPNGQPGFCVIRPNHF